MKNETLTLNAEQVATVQELIKEKLEKDEQRYKERQTNRLGNKLETKIPIYEGASTTCFFEVKCMPYGYVYCLFPRNHPKIDYVKKDFGKAIYKESDQYIPWKHVLGKILNDYGL